MATAAASSGIGPLLRDWRKRRRLSQLDLALEAGVSARHLSFVETGRSRPSVDMVLQLADQLDVPLRNRNQLLLAAGHAPVFEQHALEDPEMAPVRRAIDLILAGHDPYPAVVIDHAWEMLGANRAVALLTDGVAPELLEPPVNVLRVSLHPDGVAPRIANLGEWRRHLLDRLERQIALTGDPALAGLLEELQCLPGARARARRARDRRPAAPAQRRRRAVVHQHGGHVRHRGGGHRQRALDRVLLPRGRPDRSGRPGLRRGPALRPLIAPPPATRSTTPSRAPDGWFASCGGRGTRRPR